MNTDGQRVVDLSDIDSQHISVDYQDGDLAILTDIRQIPEFSSMKMGMNVILFCLKGKLQFEVNGRQITVRERELSIVQSHVSVGNLMVSPDFQCRIACMSDRLVKQQLRGYITIWNRALYVNNTNIFRIPEDQPLEQMGHFYELVNFYFTRPRKRFRQEVIGSLLRCFLLDICELMEEQTAVETSSVHSQGDQLFNRFLQILSESQVKRQTVESYADQLCVSPKYLSAVCKKTSGKTAMQWINEYVMEDIRYYLKETSLTIKEISTTLGFPNLSFFGKYTKRSIGMSPKEYRNQRS
ncbi:MAG: AraC family transcriptional regulator [Prevotella sp.]|nr:AraC family transcriptional regulator [Prevotella sp.]